MNKPILQRHRDIVSSMVSSHLSDKSLFHGINNSEYPTDIKDAFAQYIANNEKVEDAILLEAREICAEVFEGDVKDCYISGQYDGSITMRATIAALQRREPVEVETVTENSEENPWILWDGAGSPVPYGEIVEVMWDSQVFTVLTDIVDWDMVSIYRVPDNPSFKEDAS